MSLPERFPSDDDLSFDLDISQYDTQGFCVDYPLRRHIFETDANAGSHEARQDWKQYVASSEHFGGCNPINGNFTALVLPLCKPERLRLTAYILEYAFLYDNVLETDTGDNSTCDRKYSATDQVACQPANPILKKKQIQAKMILELTTMDKICTKRVTDVWQTMISTTLREKDRQFTSLEDYVAFRIIDTGAPFVESMMLFGMGMTLSPEEDALLKDVVYPCYAALGLANDYFSFDREYSELQESGSESMTNAVWLFMRWRGVNCAAAKDLVKEATTDYEKRFQAISAEFRRVHAPLSEKLDRYLRGLAYQISGNVVWSLNCPRYHPERRYDPNAGIEDDLAAKGRPRPASQGSSNLSRGGSIRYHETSEGDDHSSHLRKTSLTESTISSYESIASSIEGSRSPSSNSSGSQSPSPIPEFVDYEVKHARLDENLIRGPFEYVKSMPSKGLRNGFIDALSIWFDIAEEQVDIIKCIIDRLHTASLMLDDIQDGSPLRRGQPAAHTLFGEAQTINSANLAIIEAIKAAGDVGVDGATRIILDELQSLHVGQGYDIYWTRHNSCPTEDEYLAMVDKKTGGLFRLLARLLVLVADDPSVNNELDKLVRLIGQHFQIRDDYQNLSSTEYASQKGFCEDLDEGKPSFPLTHCLRHQQTPSVLHEVLRSRQDTSSLTLEAKRLVLHELDQSGSLEHTRQTLRRLQNQIEVCIGRIERIKKQKNWVLRLFVEKLGV